MNVLINWSGAAKNEESWIKDRVEIKLMMNWFIHWSGAAKKEESWIEDRVESWGQAHKVRTFLRYCSRNLNRGCNHESRFTMYMNDYAGPWDYVESL